MNDYDECGHHEHDQDSQSHSHGKGNFLTKLGGWTAFFHGHQHAEPTYDGRESSARGVWALKVSLGVLAVTALVQIIFVFISGSAGLLADSIHNFSDAATAIPLGMAFLLGRRLATRRYTYGYGKAEDYSRDDHRRHDLDQRAGRRVRKFPEAHSSNAGGIPGLGNGRGHCRVFG
jgi:hypothetical protein